jgi:dolichyl-phosphate beta-glucosyltransferase
VARRSGCRRAAWDPNLSGISQLMQLSLIIPAFNEAGRLPAYLTVLRPYLDAHHAEYEVLVVDDGSRDGTAEFVDREAAGWKRLHLLGGTPHRGKGAAVRTGVLAARGDLLLITDADGAAPVAEEARLRQAIEGGADLAVGSRLRADVEVPRARRHWHRGLAGRLFARLARAALEVPVLDPQCGFKMFRGDAGRTLFAACPEDGYLSDLFVLILAVHLGYRIAEVPIRWTDRSGSKVRLFRDSCRMVTGLPRLRAATAAMTLRRDLRVVSDGIDRDDRRLGAVVHGGG